MDKYKELMADLEAQLKRNRIMLRVTEIAFWILIGMGLGYLVGMMR